MPLEIKDFFRILPPKSGKISSNRMAWNRSGTVCFDVVDIVGPCSWVHTHIHWQRFAFSPRNTQIILDKLEKPEGEGEHTANGQKKVRLSSSYMSFLMTEDNECSRHVYRIESIRRGERRCRMLGLEDLLLHFDTDHRTGRNENVLHSLS